MLGSIAFQCTSFWHDSFYFPPLRFFAFVNPIYSLQVRWEEDYRKAYLPSILFGRWAKFGRLGPHQIQLNSLFGEKVVQEFSVHHFSSRVFSCLGCFNIDWLTCSAMYIEQTDETGEEWARTTYVLGQSFRHGSYTLKKATPDNKSV